MWRIYLKDPKNDLGAQLLIAGADEYIQQRYNAMVSMPSLRGCLVVLMHNYQVMEVDVVQ